LPSPGYAALEAALKYRYRVETGNVEAKMMLSNLIEHAIAHKWLNAAEFEFPVAWMPDGKFSELDMIRRMRNDLAHGQLHLGVGGSFSAWKPATVLSRDYFPPRFPATADWCLSRISADLRLLGTFTPPPV
jgi:hypothetical protein